MLLCGKEAAGTMSYHHNLLGVQHSDSQFFTDELSHVRWPADDFDVSDQSWRSRRVKGCNRRNNLLNH